MTVLSVCIKVAPRIGLAVPTSLFGSSEYELIQLQNLANDAADMIVTAHPFQRFAAKATFAGDDVTTAFDMPEDFHWIPPEHDVFSSSTQAPMCRVENQNQWESLQLNSWTGVDNSWIILADQINFLQTLTTGEEATVWYQVNTWAADVNDDPKAGFDADDDYFRLTGRDVAGARQAERLLELAMLYKWKVDKGLAYAQHMDDYAALLELIIGRESGGSRTLRPGSSRRPRGVRFAWPGRLGG